MEFHGLFSESDFLFLILCLLIYLNFPFYLGCSFMIPNFQNSDNKMSGKKNVMLESILKA